MNKPNTQRGQVIIINTLLFFAISTAIIFAVTSPVISSFHITKSFSKSTEAFLLANSATNEVLYKLKTNQTLASTESLTLLQGSAVIAVANTSDGKTISIRSDVDSYQKNYELEVSTGSGVSFNYGLQVGQGGFDMSNSSGIIGNVYSNGDIIGTDSPYITGTAVSANVSDPVVAASNNGLVDPPTQINFGGNSVATPQDIAQSFTVSTTTPVSSIRLLIKKLGSPFSNITMRIVADNGGNPHKTTLAQATISASTVTTTFNYLTIPLDSTIALTPGNTYWLVFDTVNFGGPYYALGANDNTFSGGTAKLSTAGWSSSTGGTWITTTPNTLDVYFDTYVGGSTGVIDGLIVGSGGVGDAWSYEVKNSTVAGIAYCQTGSNNGGKLCNTSRSVPVQQSWPISDGNIDDWKAEALAGGATSTVSLGGSETKTIGPMKINGNLDLSNFSVLNVNGTVHVTGNVSLSNFAKIRVNPSLGATSVVIVVDGRITTSNSTSFEGSGASGSYIMLVSTNTCPTGSGCSGNNAIEMSNAGGAVIVNAQNGTIKFSNHAQARQASAYKIVMVNDTTVTYESGLVNPTFTSGPSGSWIVESWKEVE